MQDLTATTSRIPVKASSFVIGESFSSFDNRIFYGVNNHELFSTCFQYLIIFNLLISIIFSKFYGGCLTYLVLFYWAVSFL